MPGKASIPFTPALSHPGEGARRWLGRAALFALAAAYFSLGWSLSMEWMDQGQLLYPSWRVAEGAVPLRDFAHMYGPSTFLFVGFLLRVFGPDVFVVRMSLILLKAAIALIAYVYTRRIASRSAALAAFALCVAILGTPWWIFNTPYPNHFALALNLAGFWVLIACAARPLFGSFLAGLCFGVSATFKQTLGAFALVAVLWFALYEREERATEPAGARLAPALLGALGALRLLVLAVSLLLFAGYVAKYPHVWTDTVLVGPVVAVVALLAWREKRVPATPRDHMLALRTAVGAGAGFAVPLVVCVVYYASIGALDALRFSTVTVPAAMDWFVPVPFPKARTVLLVVAVVSAAIAAAGGGARARLVRRVAWVICLLALAAFAASIVRAEGVRAYLRTEAWIGEVFSLVFWMPVALCSAELVQIAAAGGARVPEKGAVLMAFYGVAALQHLYPAADFWHLLNMLPLYTILLGHQLDRLRPGPAAQSQQRGRVVSAVVGGALVVSLGFPFAYALARARVDRLQSGSSIPRASGILDANPKFEHAAALVAYLADPQRASRNLAVVANEQMLYFVTGRHSVWDGKEFLLYLVGARLLHGDGARALLDEGVLLERLASQRPLLVDNRDSEASKRLWDTFPSLARHVAERYRPVASFGGYVVLDDAGS